MKRLLLAFFVISALCARVDAAPPPWAKDVKTTVTKTSDSEEVVVEVDGVKMGRRQDKNGTYDLVWERDARLLGLRHRLHSHKITRVFPDEGEPLAPPDAALAADVPMATGTPPDVPIVIDLNYMYSAAALTKIGGPTKINAFAALTCALITQSYANSGRSDVTWRCRGPFLSAYKETTDGEALAWMTNSAVGKAEIAAHYAQTGADGTHMITTNGACGLGYMYSTNRDYALSMSEAGCTNANLSGPHEAGGHNLNMNHDPANAQCTLVLKPSGLMGCTGGFNYGHAFPIGAIKWRTVMAYPGAGGQRITQYSNPAILYQGLYPTGIVNERDNIRVASPNLVPYSNHRTAVPTTGRPPSKLLNFRIAQ